MAEISKSTHKSVDMKLSEASETIRSARELVPQPRVDVDRALRVIDECRAAIGTTDDIDTVVKHLRAASRALEHHCAGPSKICVSAAIRLIDQAIGGATF